MPKLSLRDLDVRGKRVLVRVDFNVPIAEHDRKIDITDDTRIRESLATIKTNVDPSFREDIHNKNERQAQA